jgi:Holliday junction resolvase RusA-like endonuclease
MPKLTIPGSLPNLNDYINAERRSKYQAAGMKRQAEHTIMLLAKSQLRGFKPSGPVWMLYRWIEKDRRRDKDNICFARKFIQDALVSAGVLKNDGWKEIAGFTDVFEVDKKNPRIVVEITEVPSGNADP